MNVKLTPIPIIKQKCYDVLVCVMHGDADKYEDIIIPCKTEEVFISRMTALKNQPSNGSEGGDEEEYAKWCETNFAGCIPYDCIFSGGNLARVESIKGFYYDEHGVKFKAEVVE